MNDKKLLGEDLVEREREKIKQEVDSMVDRTRFKRTDANKELAYILHDSGERREFETGAARDMEAGKGRFDLLPACAIARLARHYEAGANKYEDRNWEKGIPISVMMDSALRHIFKYMDGKIDEDHLVAAAWNIMGAMWLEEKMPNMQDIPSRMTPLPPQEREEI